MTTTLWVTCPTADDIPPVHQLAAWTTDDQLVALRFPPDALVGPGAKTAVVARLAAALPECSVFDSGGDRTHEWVTVMRVIPTESVVANADRFLAAMRQFRRTATSLAHLLAERAGVPPARLLDAVLAHHRAVDLGGGWHSGPHGFGCRFENRVTGQVVDVRLEHGAEFGALDPFYFALFLKTTPGLEPLGRLLRDDYHDGKRVLDYFRAGGQVVQVEGRYGSGWVVREVKQPPEPSSPCQAPPGWWGED